jgi:hypothetical protein
MGRKSTVHTYNPQGTAPPAKQNPLLRFCLGVAHSLGGDGGGRRVINDWPSGTFGFHLPIFIYDQWGCRVQLLDSIAHRPIEQPQFNFDIFYFRLGPASVTVGLSTNI